MRLETAFCILALFALAHCRSAHPTGSFSPTTTPAPPDYAAEQYWAALPHRPDAADQTPCDGKPQRQEEALVDVLFLHPTSYYGRRKKPVAWNADPRDAAVQARTDSGSIRHQATIFNTVGRIYAPRYRQAHLDAFFTRDTASAAQAFDIAYRDVLAAFEHYLTHWNNGRPFILAAHSQGAYLGMRLLRERIEGTPLQERLIVAYLVGWPIRSGDFQKIPPCTEARQTGCFCSWRTWRRDAGRKRPPQPEVVCTNPLTWSIREGEYAPHSLNAGGVLWRLCPIYPSLTDAEVYRGYLLASRPQFPGSFLFTWRNYHISDLNLYYINIQKNAEARVEAFFQR